MNILLVYPEYPPTYWSFRFAVAFQKRKAAYPPLGLMTIYPMLPKEWNKRIVDLNTTTLKEKDLQWADLVMISAMIVQKDSAQETIKRARALGKTIVAGGPLWAIESSHTDPVDHVIIGESEQLLPQFVSDWQAGNAKPVYKSDHLPELSSTPVPDFGSVRLKNYSSMLLQFSRGCPFNCEFCDIIEIYGRKARTKSNDQFVTEIDTLYSKLLFLILCY